ncbi:hypothetical protein SN11_16950 [Vibrio harveyi]|nr:hypothetical protein SN11_16950 [Vibrio harveyi]
MTAFNLIDSPLLTFNDYWGVYAFVYYLAIFYLDKTEKSVNLELSIFSKYAITIVSFYSGEVLTGNVTEQNAVRVCVLARCIELSLLRAEKEKLISNIELI